MISRLGVGNHIRLSGYSKEGLFEIAKQRAALSLFSESYDDKYSRSQIQQPQKEMQGMFYI